jgi:hypothetical protein
LPSKPPDVPFCVPEARSETGYRVRILHRSHTTQLHRLEIASRVKGAVNGTYEMVLAGRGASYWGVIDGSGETESRIE